MSKVKNRYLHDNGTPMTDDEMLRADEDYERWSEKYDIKTRLTQLTEENDNVRTKDNQ